MAAKLWCDDFFRWVKLFSDLSLRGAASWLLSFVVADGDLGLGAEAGDKVILPPALGAHGGGTILQIDEDASDDVSKRGRSLEEVITAFSMGSRFRL